MIFLIEYFALALHFGSGFINSNSQKRDMQKGTVISVGIYQVPGKMIKSGFMKFVV